MNLYLKNKQSEHLLKYYISSDIDGIFCFKKWEKGIWFSKIYSKAF